MRNSTQTGSAATVLIIVLLALGFLASAGFGYWAFSQRQDYKNNVDKKVAASVVTAEKLQAEKLQKEFEEQSKSPYTTYQGSSTYGSLAFDYPKTWSAYVSEGGPQPINNYYHPKQVPAVSSTSIYALRVELVSSPYATVMQSFNSAIKTGKLKATAYVPEKLQSANLAQPGSRLDGEVAPKVNGSMVVIPLRDKTLKVYTMSGDYLPDFNKIILPSLTFTP